MPSLQEALIKLFTTGKDTSVEIQDTPITITQDGDNTTLPSVTTTPTAEERIASLEAEIAHLRNDLSLAQKTNVTLLKQVDQSAGNTETISDILRGEPFHPLYNEGRNK